MIINLRRKHVDVSIRFIAHCLLFLSLAVSATVVCARTSDSAKQIADPLAEQLAHYFQLSDSLSFRDITLPQASGDIKQLQQTYAGVDIDQAIIAVRVNKAGNIVRVYGSVVDTAAVDLPVAQQLRSTVKALTDADAQAVAQSYLAGVEQQGDWRIQQWNETTVVARVDGQFVRALRLGFLATNDAQDISVRPMLLINPNTGELLRVEDSLRRSVQAGSGLGGNTLTGQHDYSFTSDATDALNSGTFLVTRTDTTCAMVVTPNVGEWQNNVRLFKGNDATDVHEYACTEITEGDVNTGRHDENLVATLQAYSPINDAAYHAQVAFNLYERFAKTRDLGPLREIGRPLDVRVHYKSRGLPSDNAFWNGEFIALGDGLVSFLPKVSADTLGHELGHAFLEHYSLINQNSGVPLGIAESFGDIAGEATEYAIAQMEGAENDWKYAAETFKPTLEDAARYFENPELDGKSIGSVKDWNVTVKGHHQAGPLNKAFFHLITENAGWNPIIGFDLWITAATDCWVPATLYPTAAQCLVDSVDTFRANNTELAPTWTSANIRRALILAFAKADIFTSDSTALIALFDAEPYFDDMQLINASSIPGAEGYQFQWFARGQTEPLAQTQLLTDKVIVDVAENETNIDVRLTATGGDASDEYQRNILLGSRFCLPAPSNNGADYIKQFGLNGALYAETGADPDGYGDHTAQPPLPLYLNAENSFVVTPNNTESSYWSAYVDFNGDHRFDKTSEVLFDLSKITSEKSVTVDVDRSLAVEGKQTRLRLVRNWSFQTDPCLGDALGEYEDYTVTLVRVPEANFTATVTPGTYSVTLRNTSEAIPEGAQWVWRYQKDSADWVVFSNEQNAVLELASFGPVTIELQLITTEQVVFQKQQTVEVPAKNPEPDFDFSVNKKTATVTFTNTSKKYNENALWRWDYGDGNHQEFTEFKATHEYKYDVDSIGKDVQQITVTLSLTENGQTFQQQKTMSRDALPKAGAITFLFPLFIGLLLLRLARVRRLFDGDTSDVGFATERYEVQKTRRTYSQ